MDSILVIGATLLMLMILGSGMVLWGVVQIIAKRRGWW